MTRFKVYTGCGPYQGSISLPTSWLGIGDEDEWNYGYVCVVAETKEHASLMLRARQLSPWAAARITRSLRASTGLERATQDELIAAGVIPTDRRGVYVWHTRDDGITVYRVDPGFRQLTPVARFEGPWPNPALIVTRQPEAELR